MPLKLNNLKMPLKWEQVAKIAGNGVAPGRVHIAHAMVEVGYVENLRQAFSRYLYDDGPAYSRGSEPPAEDVIHLILDTGGVATLAHPWALKDPIAVISILKTAGLHAVEVYRSDGKVEALSDLCDKYALLKVGGSDYHMVEVARTSLTSEVSIFLSWQFTNSCKLVVIFGTMLFGYTYKFY